MEHPYCYPHLYTLSTLHQHHYNMSGKLLYICFTNASLLLVFVKTVYFTTVIKVMSLKWIRLFYNPGVGRPHIGPVIEEIISESEKERMG